MKRTHYIAWDVHSSFCEGGYVDHEGREKGSWHRPTSIPELLKAIESVPRPRKMVIEEGPPADWLCRHLGPHVDEMICCDAHRNALIAKDREKSDPIDWRKLAGLYRGGYVKKVHHPQELSRSLFKQHVQLYHERVRHRVSEALKLIWRVRRFGVPAKEKDLAKAELRQAMIKKLPADELARLPTNTKGAWMANVRSASRDAIRLARSPAAVMWGMWKSGSVFDPTLVAKSAASVS